MKLGTLEWRAVAPPAAVVALAVAILLWFSQVRIPAVERYLEDANLRVLRTTASQLKSKIDGIDGHLDVAIQWLDVDELADNQAGFATLVRQYTGDLEIVCADLAGRECAVPAGQPLWAAVKDRAVAQVRRESGRDYLYLAYARGRRVKVVARVDIGKVFADTLPAEREFDALLLVDPDGRVMAQHSAEGLNLSRVDPLGVNDGHASRLPAESGSAPGDAAPSSRFPGSVQAPKTVVVGGTAYRLYAQPVSLSLQRLPAGADVPGGTEEWTLCGLVAADELHAASAAVSYDLLLLFGAALIAVCAAIPLLKLRMLHPHERLTRTDATLVGIGIVVQVALCAFVLLEVHASQVAVPRLIDQQLQAVGRGLLKAFTKEAHAIDAQMAAYDLELHDHARVAARYGDSLPRIALKSVKCEPEWPCREAILRQDASGLERLPYPFFDLATWVDLDGNQRVKWTTSPGVTPFINVSRQGVPYFNQLRAAQLLGSRETQKGVSVLMSPTTGKRLTVFWHALPARRTGSGTLDSLAGQSLALNPVTFDQPVLPAETKFAIVDRAGLVLFHSDRTRSMKENFIQESGRDLALRALVEERRSGSLTATYRARSQRVFVTPVVFDETRGPGPFPSPDWSLIVFQDRTVPETLNLYTLVMAGSIFGCYAATLFVVCWFVMRTMRQRALSWLWPDRRRSRGYWAASAVNGGVTLTSVLGLYLFATPAALSMTVCGVLLAVAANVWLVTRTAPPRSGEAGRASRRWQQRWLPAFLCARASLVVVLAVLPALASMHTAQNLERRTYMRHDASRQAALHASRMDYLQSRVPLAAICPPASVGQPCQALSKYVTHLEVASHWFPTIPPLFADQADPIGETPRPPGVWGWSITSWFLAMTHRPVNDLGVELASAVTGVVPRQAPPSLWWLAFVPVLALVAYRLVGYATDRLCLPGVDGLSAGTRGAAADAGHRLIIVPPGRDATVRPAGRGAQHVDLRLRSLPAGAQGASPCDVLIVHHLEVALVDGRLRRQVLAWLETAVYEAGQTVWLVSDREPVRHLETLRSRRQGGQESSTIASNEGLRWILLLQSFRCEFASAAVRAPMVGLMPAPADALVPGDPFAPEGLRCPGLAPLIEDVRQRFHATSVASEDWWRALDETAELYYRSLWTACTTEERLVLRQLTEEGLVNPCDQDVVVSLMRKGLVVRDPAFRLMNTSFGRFVCRAVTPQVIAGWEQQVAGTPWSSVRTALLTFAVAGAGFVAFTQQQLVSAWFGLVPALAPAVFYPMLRDAMGKLLAQRLTSPNGRA